MRVTHSTIVLTVITALLARAPARAQAPTSGLRLNASGRETVTYVSNIYKYYVAYLLVQGEYIQRRELKQKAPAPATREH
jgi:hypothetical protein